MAERRFNVRERMAMIDATELADRCAALLLAPL